MFVGYPLDVRLIFVGCSLDARWIFVGCSLVVRLTGGMLWTGDGALLLGP